MKKLFISLSLLIILSTCLQAQNLPGWDKTTWGMDRSQVLAAMSAYRLKSESPGKLVFDGASIEGIIFYPTLFFSDGKLIKVSLIPVDKTDISGTIFSNLKVAYSEKYGQPATNKDITNDAEFVHIATWKAGLTDISLEYMYIPEIMLEGPALMVKFYPTKKKQ